jgi:hypothetical protein
MPLRSIAGFVAASVLVLVEATSAHPLGNFSVNQYSALRVGKGVIEIRYIVDMAEIPTFQEIQQNGFVPAVDDTATLKFSRERSKRYATVCGSN